MGNQISLGVCEHQGLVEELSQGLVEELSLMGTFPIQRPWPEICCKVSCALDCQWHWVESEA